MKNLQKKALGSFLGLAVGDALGTTLEFQKRDVFPKVTSLVGGGVFSLRPGDWTDDMSMALCLADSLIESKGFNPLDQMSKYCDWYKNGYNSSNGYCFDIGNTVRQALNTFLKTGTVYAGSSDVHTSGNGSLMRLSPIPIFYHCELNDDKALLTLTQYAENSSKITHSAPLCLASCKALSLMINRCFNDLSKENVLFFSEEEIFKYQLNIPGFETINLQEYKNKKRNQIKSSGYVIDSFEAALWAFYNTDNFKDGVILAINLADDSDTVGAIYGQIAGAYYGIDQIPEEWINKLTMNKNLIQTLNSLLDTSQCRKYKE